MKTLCKKPSLKFIFLLGLFSQKAGFLSAAELAAPTFLFENSFIKENHEACESNFETLDEHSQGAHDIKIYQANDWGCVLIDIFKNGTLVYHKEGIGTHFYMGIDWQEEIKPLIHLTHKSIPNLIVSEWTGGAHCCFLLHIFELGEEFRKIATIDGGNYYPQLEDLDKDGIFEIKLYDDFLAYIFSSFAWSAIGEVVLKYSYGSYQIAPEFMTQAPPTLSSYNSRLGNWREEFGHLTGNDPAPQSFIQEITNLAFSGNEEIAFELIDYAWPQDTPGKELFVQEYKKALGWSKYYPEFKRVHRIVRGQVGKRAL